MEIANGMGGKNMNKTVNSLSKDFKSLNQNPCMGLFYGKRTRFEEENETVEKGPKGSKQVVKKVMKQYDDQGTLVFLKQKGNVVINNIF